MRILIHIGPPKSGTSAIQKWLVTNHKYLLENGVYYPVHDCDNNGISSGNVLALYNRLENNKLVFSEEKYEQLCRHCTALGCDSLLLSSEFFFQRILELNTYFPSAEFIAYLRFPIEVAESSYNQGVKRHNETRKFGLPAVPQSPQLGILRRAISALSINRFILRPYHKQCFSNNNIVADFLTAIGCNLTSAILESLPTAYVNKSYTLECLEFKRWMNQLPLGSLAHRLDSFLQSYTDGMMDYSLVPEKKFYMHKEAFVKKLRNFCEQFPVDNSQTFIQLCEDIKQKKPIKQEISDAQFFTIFQAFLAANRDIRMELFEFFNKKCADINVVREPHRLEIIQNSFGVGVYLQYVVYWLKQRLRLILNHTGP